ncbi:MAG: DUF4251 domain-containing protein [Chitinophagaceae bacterium]|nr:DUF4251 domain-containing protein [Chitinophagaceae bacterium]
MKYRNLFIVLLVLLASSTSAQTGNDESASKSIKSIIESRQFTFNARTMLPTAGITRQLTFGYKLRVAGDSVVADLPYFGRAYNAPIGQGDGGINFTSAQSSVTVTNAKKDGWNILIKPKDVKEIRQLTLQVSENGQTTVTVISNSRQAISYWGDLTSVARQ